MNTNATHRASPPRLPREQWAQHPHFPGQALLLGSHASFCAINARLIEQAQRGGTAAHLESRYRSWIAAMRSHEGYEEHKLYPYLARRWGVSFDEAEAGHHALHEAHAGVLSAFSGLRTQESADRRASVVKALQEHERVLQAHLQVEEDLVIPLLLGLSPNEFERYYYSSIATLMRDLDRQEAN